MFWLCWEAEVEPGYELFAFMIDSIYLMFLWVFDVSGFDLGGSIEPPDPPQARKFWILQIAFALQVRALVFEKFACAYLFQVALGIIGLTLQTAPGKMLFFKSLICSIVSKGTLIAIKDGQCWRKFQARIITSQLSWGHICEQLENQWIVQRGINPEGLSDYRRGC